MPVYRRRTASSIAKINARSIDGYFGAGTPCFFIRGTILSDVQVEGEYRTLDIRRPGNTIEIEDYEGDWATVAISTREGNRPGDNLQARLFLRESDLRSVGIDVERIMAGFAPFETPDEPEELDEDLVPASNGTSNGHIDIEALVPPPAPPPPPPPAAPSRAMQPTIERAVVPEPLAPSPEPEREPVPAAPEAAAAVPDAPAAPAPAAAKPDAISETVVVEHIEREIARTSSLFGGASTTLVDGKLLVEVGASVVAIGLPVVLFFMRSLFSKRNR